MGKGHVLRWSGEIILLVVGALITNIHLVAGSAVIALAISAGAADLCWDWICPGNHGFRRLIIFCGLCVALSIGGTALAAWIATGYYVSYITCGEGVQPNPRQMRGFKLGYGLLNRNAFPLYFQVQEQSFTVDDQAVPLQKDAPIRKVGPLKETGQPSWASLEMPFRRPVHPNPEPLHGTIRWVVKYGRTEADLDHPLVISGPFTIRYRFPGTPEVLFQVNGDSSDHWEGQQSCNL